MRGARLAEMIAAAHIVQSEAQADATSRRRPRRSGSRTSGSAARSSRGAERWHSTDVRLQDRSRGQGDALPRSRLGARGAGRGRAATRIANMANAVGADLRDACRTSTGSASTATSATNWCSGRSRAGRPASASRSAQGVCGAAAKTPQVQRVDDVHAFPGHIACDARLEQRDGGADRSATANCSGCSTSTARRTARFDARR